MRRVLALAVLAALVLAAPARAEVAASAPSNFEIRATADSSATPDRAWRAITQVGHWWGSDHTYSGNSNNLHLDPRAGGCWCERWAGGQVEHMRVVSAFTLEGQRTLRLVGGLGPLQELPVTGVMTFTVQARGAGATVTMTYRVAGDAGLHLDQIAPGVDHVLMEQFGRLIRYTGQD